MRCITITASCREVPSPAGGGRFARSLPACRIGVGLHIGEAEALANTDVELLVNTDVLVVSAVSLHHTGRPC